MTKVAATPILACVAFSALALPDLNGNKKLEEEHSDMIQCNPPTKRRTAAAGSLGARLCLAPLEVSAFCVNDTGKSSDCLLFVFPAKLTWGVQ